MSDNLDILVQNLRGERDEYPGEYVREAAEAIDRLRAEVRAKERDPRRNPIPIGVGEVLVGNAYDADDPDKIEREVVIHSPGTGTPLGQEAPAYSNVSTDDIEVLARLRIVDPSGAFVLLDHIHRAMIAAGYRPLPFRAVEWPVEARHAVMQRDVELAEKDKRIAELEQRLAAGKRRVDLLTGKRVSDE